jgi:hypothetical protein
LIYAVGANVGKDVRKKTGLLVGASVAGPFVGRLVSDSLGSPVRSMLGRDIGVSMDLTKGAGVGSMETISPNGAGLIVGALVTLSKTVMSA